MLAYRRANITPDAGRASLASISAPAMTSNASQRRGLLRRRPRNGADIVAAVLRIRLTTPERRSSQRPFACEILISFDEQPLLAIGAAGAISPEAIGEERLTLRRPRESAA